MDDYVWSFFVIRKRRREKGGEQEFSGERVPFQRMYLSLFVEHNIGRPKSISTGVKFLVVKIDGRGDQGVAKLVERDV